MAPVAVHMPAGPITLDMPVFLDSNEPLVIATVFLPWQSHPAAGAAPARMSLPTWLMLRAWIRRCTLSSLPADLAILAVVDVFELSLSAAAWSRILTELVASGLLLAQFTDASTLDAALDTLTISNPGDLVILASDLIRCESFETPGTPAVPAVPARAARRGQPAVRAQPAVPAGPPTPGPPALRFIHLCRLPRLEDPADRSPLLALALAAGAFGAVATRASRDDETATVVIAATILKPNVERFAAGGGALADAAVAVNLPKVLVAAHRALGILRTSTYSEAAAISDLTDGLRYLLGGLEERRAIEARRSLYAKDHVRCRRRPFRPAGAPQPTSRPSSVSPYLRACAWLGPGLAPTTSEPEAGSPRPEAPEVAGGSRPKSPSPTDHLRSPKRPARARSESPCDGISSSAEVGDSTARQEPPERPASGAPRLTLLELASRPYALPPPDTRKGDLRPPPKGEAKSRPGARRAPCLRPASRGARLRAERVGRTSSQAA